MAGTNNLENINDSGVSAVGDEVCGEVVAKEGMHQNGNGNDLVPDWEHVLQLKVNLPHHPFKTDIMVSTREAIQDVRQTIIELPSAIQYTCFHLKHNGERLNDYIEVSEAPGLSTSSELHLVEDPYTEKEARLHLLRIKELIGLSTSRIDPVYGLLAGLSLHDHLIPVESSKGKIPRPNNVGDFTFEAAAKIDTILPKAPEEPPKCAKEIIVSQWNPPPHHLRISGHLLYLRLTTIEDKVYHITSHVRGFFVNKSSDDTFDPFPKSSPSKSATVHSLLTLVSHVSPTFDQCLRSMQEFNSKRDPLTTFQLSNALPSNPWLLPSYLVEIKNHKADLTRPQENYLISGADSSETLRDWNEEFQSTRELQKETIQERVQRERLVSKVFADYNESAVRGAMMVAHGEVAALNPTENKKAQIFVNNNIFFSFGADGVGTFATDGGDEAARVAVSKDVVGVKAVNQLDIHGLFTPATVVVDYLGQRIVGQSIVPGIFKQRGPGEHQIDYGGVEGKDIVTENQEFVPLFEQLSKAMRVKKHVVWDKENEAHVLEGSVETKGLIGTDGRKYVLDLYRLTPLDILWLEEHWSERENGRPVEPRKNYPHRMANLRPELIETYGRHKLGEFVKEKMAKRNNGIKSETAANGVDDDMSDEHAENKDSEIEESSSANEQIDVSDFEFSLNPDVFCGQVPQEDKEKIQMAEDEEEVRRVCNFLRSEVIPHLIHDLREGSVGFPTDGQSLSGILHRRGINIRYLGKIAELADIDDTRLQALRRLAIQEMITRAFKHLTNRYLSQIPYPFASTCIAHLLNCFLGVAFNPNPHPDTDESLKYLYPEADFGYEKVTPDNLRLSISEEVLLRYGLNVGDTLPLKEHHLQYLRDLSLKLGLQLEGKDYDFFKRAMMLNHDAGSASDSSSMSGINGINGNAGRKKKKRGNRRQISPRVNRAPVTFRKENIFNLLPVVKDGSPKSAVADEALEAGRVSLIQDQKEIGQELLLESLTLHEQIYGVLHPEVARAYYQLSTLYYGINERNAAVDLARKAVIVAERTLGVDNSETILGYLNLSLLEHAVGNSNAALLYIKHALELWKIVYGQMHPDSITTINNAAVMLQSMKCYHDSRVWFETSVAVSEGLSGKESTNSATLLFQLAQALALDHDSRGAVINMRKSYNIFKDILGAEDRNTKEAELWLEQLTQNAVSQARQAKLKGPGSNLLPGMTLQTRPQPSIGQSSTDTMMGSNATRNASLDNRSMEELLRYIEGDARKSSHKRKPSSIRSKAAIKAR